MIDWEKLSLEYDEIIQKLSDASSKLDHKSCEQLQRRASELNQQLALHNEITSVEKEIKECEQLKSEDLDLAALYQEEISQKKEVASELEKQLDDILFPPDKRDMRSVFLELRAGAGGQESALFVADLFKMYSNYAMQKAWNVSIVDASENDIGGYRELIVHIKGKGVFQEFKHESGVHRVQRVPQTEAAGRIHTSTVTVAVMPEADEVDIKIEQKDLRIDVFRSSGAGGQHVNTTDSAVRIVHLPTGVTVSCQDERSQIKNRAKAMKVLQARLYEEERRKHEEAIAKERRQKVGTGDRSEKIRTYNYPQNRVSDHRINLTLKKLDIIMQGELAELINPLMDWDRQQRRLQDFK
ncbi:peptide chain release factor 1 [bacterium]|nr:peptide chain release factor 1 [bacterium]